MYPKDPIPKSVEDFYVEEIPPISFTMQVIATDVPSNDPKFKIKKWRQKTSEVGRSIFSV